MRDVVVDAVRAALDVAMVDAATFLVVSTSCFWLLSSLEAYLEREARRAGKALQEGTDDEAHDHVSRLLLIFFPTCRLRDDGRAFFDDDAAGGDEKAPRARPKLLRRGSLAGALFLRPPAPRTSAGSSGRFGATGPYALGRCIKCLDALCCAAGPAGLCFAWPRARLAFRIAAVARVLLPACSTLDVAVGSVAAIMDFDREQVAGFKILNGAVRFVVWSMSSLLVLNACGFDVSAFYNGFGLGGVVLGYASRTVLEDLFAGLLLMYRRWFRVNDYVEIPGVGEGTIEEMTATSTALRLNLCGEVVHVANSKILEAGVINHDDRKKRRCNKGYYFVHDSDPDALRDLLLALDECLELPGVRPHVLKYGRAPYYGGHVMKVEPAGIKVEFVYYIADGQDTYLWKDVENEVNLAALGKMRELGLVLAANLPRGVLL